MALKARVKNLEDVAEGLRGEYRKEGDHYVLSVDAVEGWSLEDVGALKRALSTERDENEALAKVARGFGYTEEAGDDGKPIKGKWVAGDLAPEAAAKAIKRVAELEKIDVKTEAGKLAEAQIEAAKRALNESHEKALGERDTRIKFLDAQLDVALVDNAIHAALAHEEVRGNADLLMPVMRKHVQRVEKDGKFVIQVTDEGGVVKVNGKADPMDALEFARELKADSRYAGAFEGSGHSGGGGTKPGQRRTAKPEDGKLSGVSRIQRGLADPKQVAEAAGVVPASE